MKKQTFHVEEQTDLLPFLLANIDRGRNHVKGVLKRGQILVDGKSETKFNAKLIPGQVVDVLREAPLIDALKGIEILFEDDDLIVVNKEAGLLTMASQRNDYQRTAYRELTAYVKQQNPKARIFIVHRLDRDTSGVVVFAKNEHTKFALQKNWHSVVEERSYLAYVEGKVEKEEATLTSWLKETRTHKVYVVEQSPDAKKAILHYSVVRTGSQFSLLKVELETGRKNQIRVQLAEMNHPIVGDKLYGATGNPIGRLGLHASVLSFKHPTTKKLVRFEAPRPKQFKVK